MDVVHSSNIEGIFERVPYADIIPPADSKESAIRTAKEILGSPDSLVCFKVRQLDNDDYKRKLRFEYKYLALVDKGIKRTTIRRESTVAVGPYLFDFEGESRRGFVTKTVRKQGDKLTDEDAQADGFDTTANLVRALRRYYPTVTNDTMLSVCHISLVNECQIQSKLSF